MWGDFAEERKGPHRHMNHIVPRLLFFVLGTGINSMGISLITLGSLGTSPISSTPYVASLAFPALSFGMTTFIWNVLFILIQVALLRRRFKPSQFLQVAANLLFSAMIDVSMALFGFLHPTALWQQLLCVVAGCVVLALGIVIEVAPNVIVVPGEGVVRALAIVTGVRYGTVKAVFDVSLIVIAVVLSLVCFHGLRGVGVGTIVSALLVGPVINVINRVFRFPDRIRALALAHDAR